MYKRLLISLLLLFIIICTGTFGYVLIEKWRFFDSLYMTVITIGTVGFHEVMPLSYSGKIFTIWLIVFGIGVGGYALANLSAFIIEGHIRNVFRSRKMQKRINQLNNHIIVCGYGRTGVVIINEFVKSKSPFVIVEINTDLAEELKTNGFLVLEGDATDDEILEQAGVHRAAGLVTTLPNDADNVYVTLTARGMNPKLRIVSRAIDDLSSRKLMRAGADKVISPYAIAGKRMANLFIKPGIVDFLDVMTQSEEFELKIEEVRIEKTSALINKRLRESNIKGETGGATIIGYLDTDEKIMINPPGDLLLHDGLILYALGTNEQIQRLLDLAK
ncbi:hypothetical protein B6D60_03190 [candidate division KSB1 bacterium 4484_87]|nr:MAG: hypothetical protein B6D60_03190 [candidate division KSB1 bacterium 4484_87]